MKSELKALTDNASTGVSAHNQINGTDLIDPASGLSKRALDVSNKSALRGAYYDQAYGAKLFLASLQSATAFSVGLSTTYTGLCVSNPAASTVNLVLNQVSFALTVAPAGIASVGLILGFLAGGVTVHTTALASPAISATKVGNTAAPSAKADSACTLVGTPYWGTQLLSGFTAGALPSAGLVTWDLNGSIILPPGAYCAIGALTAVTGLASLSWSEVPV